MRIELRERWLLVFFAVAACSWVPHWSCHYYRLETGTSFVVGSWDFSQLDSWASLTIYSVLIAFNVGAVAASALRKSAAAVSGAMHLLLGGLHLYRLIRPFRFEVFGQPWSPSSSLREALIVIPFGLLCLLIARSK